jgi:hypothetical protein
MWRSVCGCFPDASETTESACGSCGASGIPDGWSLTVHEAMACYQYVYGLKPMGPHRQLADSLFAGLRAKCTRCRGRGLLGAINQAWQICPQCEGTGGAWIVQDVMIQQTRATVLAQYPEAAVQSTPARLTSPFLALSLDTSEVLDLNQGNEQPRVAQVTPDSQPASAQEGLPDRIDLPSEIQDQVDNLIAGLSRSDGRGHPSFLQLTEWCEEYGDELGIMGGELGESIDAVDLNCLHVFRDDELRDYYGPGDRFRVTDRRRLGYMHDVLNDYLDDPSTLDADVHPGCFLLPLLSRTGSRAYLGGGIRGYSFSLITFDWFGVYRSKKAFQAAMLRRGFVTTVAAFRRLPVAKRLAYWEGPRLRGRKTRQG